MNVASVLFWNKNRAFGFAACEDGSPDVLVHASNLPASRRNPQEGDRFTFDPGLRAGRPVALNIKFLTPITPVVGSQS
jgi:cold shock CspA family protein